MSFEKRQNWLNRNQGKIAVAIAVATIGAWGCQSTKVPTAAGGEDAVNLGRNGATGTATTPAKPGTTNPAQPGGQTTTGGTDATGGQTTTGGSTPITGGEATTGGTTPAAPDALTTTPNVVAQTLVQPTQPMNPATANAAPIQWNHKATQVDPAVAATLPKDAKAVITGRVVDEKGQPAAGVPVITDLETTTTNAEGFYSLKIQAMPGSAIRFGGNEAGFVPFDDFVSLFPDETFRYDTQVLSLDDNVTKIDVTKGGTATSGALETVLGELSVNRPSASNPKNTFGLLQAPDMGTNGLKAVYLEIPPGGLILPDGQTEATVRLTWLNPMPRPQKPYGDLYGPLQTYTQWDSSAKAGTKVEEQVGFDPVNFADLDIGDAKIAPGAELRVKWVVGPEVLAKYPIQMSNGQAFMPCYQYDTGEGWTKPVLATVFQEDGHTWTQYTMRGSNPPAVVP